VVPLIISYTRFLLIQFARLLQFVTYRPFGCLREKYNLNDSIEGWGKPINYYVIEDLPLAFYSGKDVLLLLLHLHVFTGEKPRALGSPAPNPKVRGGKKKKKKHILKVVLKVTLSLSPSFIL
jgi:hypothetical protein